MRSTNKASNKLEIPKDKDEVNVYVRNVDSSTLDFSLSSHRPSFMSLILTLAFSIYIKQLRFYALDQLTSFAQHTK
jgi:hypothetical protein